MKLNHLILAILTTALWGLTFVVIKLGLGEFPPLLFAALRFVVVALPAVFLVKRQGIAWKWIIAIGLTMGVLQFGLLYIGMYNGMPAGLSSLVLQSQAIFTLLLAAVMLKDRPTRQQWLGMGVSLSGMGAIAFESFAQARLVGLLLVLGASLAWASGNITLKLANVANGFRLFIWMAIVPPLPLLGLSLWFETGQWEALRQLNGLGIGALLYTGLISSMLCFGFWGYLMQRYSPNVVAPFSLLVPVFGLLFSALLLGDSLGQLELIGGLLVFAGLALIVLAPRAASFKPQG
ncbi:EamA family transporter [Almyronema epifaneia]|uniref:EamA family transporter n=1 Tax=Almyronema epifaneia S1 TaxID=2991925 RepID=A0ABW6I958_9CYAN